MKNRLFPLLAATMLLTSVLDAHTAAAEEPDFLLQDQSGKHLDVVYGGRIVGRYMYAYDTSTDERRHETYKPYLHIFDRSGTAPITKGPGGLFTHHRGIFIGWSKIRFDGKTFDRWHMKNGEQIHRKFLKQKTSDSTATFTSFVQWNDNDETPLLEEERTMTFLSPPAPAYVLVDFSSTLTATAGNIVLDGDPEHAGIQYRPANEVEKKETRYTFASENADPKTDVDYPWVGETYTLGGKQYSVIFMNHPDNPRQTKFSAYRDYGRFGAFPKIEINSGKAVTVKYRVLVMEAAMPERDAIEKLHKLFVAGK